MRILLIWGSFLFMGFAVQAQVSDSTQKKPKADSTKIGFVNKMQAFAKRSAKSSAADFDADKATISQNKIFEEINSIMQKAKIYIKGGVDTSGAKAELKSINTDYEIAIDGVFKNPGTAQTFRNLTASSKILAELLSQADARKIRLDLHRQALNNFRYQLDSLSSIPALFKFPTDSVLLSRYIQQIVVVAKQIHPIDSALKQTGNTVQVLLNQYNLQVIKLQTGLEEIELYQKDMAGNTFKREFENIWGPTGSYRPFQQIMVQALEKSRLTLFFYAQNNIGKIVVLLLLVVTSLIYLRSLKNIYIEKQLLENDFEGQLVLRYPLLSAALIIINLFQFLFFSPPFILSVILWALAAIGLTFLFRSFITRYWMNVWLLMVALFLMAAVDNLVLQASRTERWLMLFISVAGAISGLLISMKGKKEQLREKWIVYSIAFMAVLEFGSTVANVLGRYNMSKTFLIAGFLNVVIAILFLWTVRLINEGLFLAFNVYTQQDKKLFYLNFEKVGNRAPWFLYVLLVLGWMVLFGRNFPGYDYIAGPLRTFFSMDRTIGDYTFSINNVLLFVAIMSVSILISKVVSFFASDKHRNSGKDEKNTKAGIGSWLLLIRITILSIGLFLAIAAAGIPVDRITIVLGALGVGIGFGLQTLVNNLVSGLIIAFEKPVNVGDIVDIDGKGGTMKSIGFRSSVISTWEGADLIMPNGDLLNSHLTNWSLGGNRKRMTILIGIAYDADLQKAKQVLTDVLSKEDRINKSSAPVIQYEQFNESTVDIRIYFWAKHMKESFATRSDLIIAIRNAFNENNIALPFPQQDVYLHDIRKDKEE